MVKAIDKKINITLNGQKAEIPCGLSLSEFLSLYKIDPRRVAVELNLNIIEKDKYTATSLKDGDKLEIIGFVGGGAR